MNLSKSKQQVLRKRRMINKNNSIIKKLINEIKDYKIDKDEYVNKKLTLRYLSMILAKQRAFIKVMKRKLDRADFLYYQLENIGKCEKDRLLSIRDLPLDRRIERLEGIIEVACKKCLSCKCKEFIEEDRGFPFGKICITVCSDCKEPTGGYIL